MPNISKKTAYDVKEASNQSLSQSAREKYSINAQAGFKDDNPMKMYGAPKMQGQPHMESNKQQKSNLMNDNPVAKHASNSWLSKHMK